MSTAAEAVATVRRGHPAYRYMTDRDNDGIVCEREGTEHIGPEDTFDEDYGRLLEAVQNRGKGLASLSVPSWNQVLGWLQEMDTLRKVSPLTA